MNTQAPIRIAVFTTLLAAASLGAPGAAGAEEWVRLMDGSSLDAWRGYGRDGVPEAWRIDDDGALTLDGKGGDLITRQRYDDFDLRFEWKIAPGGNSGVMYRVAESDKPPYHTGPEYQLLDDSADADGDKRHHTGALYGLYACAAEAARSAGEWNTTRIVIEDGRVEHWLNGVKVVEAELGSADWDERVAASKFAAWPGFGREAAGHIALQDHGSRVWYRDVRIRPLGERGVSSTDGGRRMLFVTQSAGFRHPTVTRKSHELSNSERVMTELGLRSGDFRVDCTQDVENDFTPELLANYDVVAFYTTGKMFQEKERLPIDRETLDWFLNTWLAEEGHGFLGVHAAADTYADYEPYWDMIGGSFDGHPWGAETTVTVAVHDASHPASRPWGATGDRFVITDEIYQFKNWQPEKVRVLMSLDMARTELKKPYHVPVLWVKPYGAGRVMHMSLGHREDVWTNPTYQESLIGGVRWLLGLEEGEAAPNPALSASEEKKASAAVTAAGG